MYRFTPTTSLKRAILTALGLTTSVVVGAGGCADRGGFALCVDTERDYSSCIELPDPGLEPDPSAPRGRYEEVCFDGADGCDPCAGEAIASAAIERVERSCTVTEIERVTLACGPDPEEAETCCYLVRVEGAFSCGVEGRPFFAGADESPRLASLQVGRAWLAGGLSGLRRPKDPETLEALRGHWLRCARYEHASVAAFARVGAQLLSLGAPPELLRATQRAMADEVRHARLCFALAAAYGGAPVVEAGPLRVAGGVAAGMDLESALREAIFEGALGEGAAAMEASEGARACDDPVVGDVLARIAKDEQGHALLAYRTIQWALAAYPERAGAIVRDCLREGDRLAARPTSEPVEDGALGPHGLVSPSRRGWIRYESWTEVVAPVLATLLAAVHRPSRARERSGPRPRALLASTPEAAAPSSSPPAGPARG